MRGMAIVVAAALVLVPVGAARANFAYPDFSSTAGLQLNGNAAQDGTALAVTPQSNSQRGSAFYMTREAVYLDFTSTFEFQVSPVGGANGGADGFLMVIQNDPRGLTALGDDGGARGYFDKGSNGDAIIKSVAIGFNTYSSDDLVIYTNANDPNAGSATPVAQANAPFTAATPNTLLGTVAYDADTTTLSFTVTDPNGVLAETSISGSVDIASIVGDDRAYFGFTAGTGGANARHLIESWQVDVVPEPATMLALMGGLAAMGGYVRRRRRPC